MVSDRGRADRTAGWKKSLQRPRRRASGLLAALALAGLLAQNTALAEPSLADKETARTLMKEGDDKFAAKDFAGALKAYQAAHAIMNVPTTGLPLAKAQIERGLLVEARDTLLQVSRHPKEAGEKPAFAQARDEAAQLAQKIADRIPSVQINVEGPSAGVQIDVTVDGVAVPPATLGTPRKVNPGQHTISASASGFQTATKNVTLKEGDNEKVSFQLKAGPSGAQTAAIVGGGRIHIESPSEPGNVFVDGKAVGATPLDVPVTAGAHKVEIEYPGGSRERQNVDVTGGATVNLKFSPSLLDSVARHRKGVHIGFSVAPSMLLFFEGGPQGAPLYGGSASFIMNIGITPTFDFRTGVTASFLYRGQDGQMQISAVVPAMLRVNYSSWFYSAAGLSGGFVTYVNVGENPGDSTAASIGPEWIPISMIAGEKRQYELSVAQGIRFGNAPTEYHQSLVFTYLMLD
jgi:hypothetical protein